MSMQALVTAPGNTAVVSRIPIPEPGSNEIRYVNPSIQRYRSATYASNRIRVHSVALNPVDPLYVAHPPSQEYGRVIGSDIAGTIDKLGKNLVSDQWNVGDRVAGLLQGGKTWMPHYLGRYSFQILPCQQPPGTKSQVLVDSQNMLF
jgi:threonine dehydrogenase-like Zn-dependent dehydrogenase